jgi:hypothetical protein
MPSVKAAEISVSIESGLLSPSARHDRSCSELEANTGDHQALIRGCKQFARAARDYVQDGPPTIL